MNKQKSLMDYLSIQATTNNDSVRLFTDWPGGKGTFRVNSLTASQSVGLSISWRNEAPGVFGGDDLRFGNVVLSEADIAAATMYDFDAPEGDLAIQLTFGASDTVQIYQACLYS